MDGKQVPDLRSSLKISGIGLQWGKMGKAEEYRGRSANVA